MVYKKILIPTDGMKASEDIIEFVCSINQVMNAQIYLIYVLEVPRNLPLDADLPEMTKNAKSAINHAVKIGDKYHVILNTSIIYARATDDAIIATANELKCDVIAIAQDNHKLSIFANTAANIYQKAKCNVWLFNNKLS